jgi:hypothetical protein
MLINKEPQKKWVADISILNNLTKDGSHLHFPLHFIQYSRLQYHWKPNGPKGHPTLELPPLDKMLSLNNPLVLPPYSLTVISENLR